MKTNKDMNEIITLSDELRDGIETLFERLPDTIAIIDEEMNIWSYTNIENKLLQILSDGAYTDKDRSLLNQLRTYVIK